MTYYVSINGEKVVRKDTRADAEKAITKAIGKRFPDAIIKWRKLGGSPWKNFAYPVLNKKRVNFYCRIVNGKVDGEWKE